jgi:hypothetical protein
MVEPRQNWEYRVERDLSDAALAALGADGWELTASDGLNFGRFIFRRPALSFVERVTLEQRARYYESLGLDHGASR